jgi:cytochrome c-type biogenesis protein
LKENDLNLDFSLLQNATPLAFILAFFGGVVTSIGPCNVATIPLIVGYVGDSHDLTRTRSFAL